MSPQPSALSLASQLRVSIQNDSSSPFPQHGPFWQVPQGARVGANAVAEAQPCPSTGTARGRWAGGSLGGKDPGKAARREGEASLEIFRAKRYPPCALQPSLQQSDGGRSPEVEMMLLLGQNWALSPQSDCGAAGAVCRWVLEDAKRRGGDAERGCCGLQSRAEGCPTLGASSPTCCSMLSHQQHTAQEPRTGRWRLLPVSQSTGTAQAVLGSRAVRWQQLTGDHVWR